MARRIQPDGAGPHAQPTRVLHSHDTRTGHISFSIWEIQQVSTPEESLSDDGASDDSTSDDAVPVEVNTPVTRKRSRAEAELQLDGDTDDSDDKNYNGQQKEAVIDRKDDDYVEVEDNLRKRVSTKNQLFPAHTQIILH